MLETFYTKQEFYIHLKISGYVQGPQSKVESGEYEPVWVNILEGLGGGGRASTGKFEVFRCPEMNDGRRGGGG